MWKKLLCLFLVLFLAVHSFSLEIKSELEELREIFQELETISIELENGSGITLAELATLKARLKKAGTQLAELKAEKEIILKEVAESRSLLDEAEKQLRVLNRRLMLEKIKAFFIGLATGAAIAYIYYK